MLCFLFGQLETSGQLSISTLVSKMHHERPGEEKQTYPVGPIPSPQEAIKDLTTSVTLRRDLARTTPLFREALRLVVGDLSWRVWLPAMEAENIYQLDLPPQGCQWHIKVWWLLLGVDPIYENIRGKVLKRSTDVWKKLRCRIAGIRRRKKKPDASVRMCRGAKSVSIRSLCESYVRKGYKRYQFWIRQTTAKPSNAKKNAKKNHAKMPKKPCVLELFFLRDSSVITASGVSRFCRKTLRYKLASCWEILEKAVFSVRSGSCDSWNGSWNESFLHIKWLKKFEQSIAI